MLRLPPQSQENTEAPARTSLDLTGERALADLVAHVRSGVRPEESFRALDGILRPWLLSYYLRASFSHADADELVQNALSRVYLGIRGLLEEARFLPWFFKIARNVKLSALERRRRESRRFVSGMEGLEDIPDPRLGGLPAAGEGDSRLRAEELSRFRDALIRLPPQQKRCLVLRVKDELSYGEIAKVLQLSVNTVRNHLQAARRSLRELLGADFEEIEET